MARFSHMLILLISLLILLFSCKGKQKEVKSQDQRPFPNVDVPKLLSGDEEKIEWISQHLWDRFLDSGKFYGSDSLSLNGVSREEVEKAMGTYVTLLEGIPSNNAIEAVGRAFSLAENFSKSCPESSMLEEFADLFRKYVYDPASPVRDEELWLSFLEPLIYSPYANEEMKASRSWEKQVCEKNRPGMPAPDFSFRGLRGKTHSLYGVKADYTVLIFGNPDCKACRELVEIFRRTPEIGEMISKGELKVLDIYIDEDIETWKDQGDKYPEEWINGYDHLGRINSERIYAVRAIPSVYLLDKNKTILLKDTPEDRLMKRLLSISQMPR